MKKFEILGSLLILSATILSAQNALGSYENDYYDFLSLIGEAERPTLNYKTLSDSVWEEEDGYKVYGPELYTSYNSNNPYGQNDGALWQGRGLNSSLTAGVRYASHGFELTFKPQVVFSQNQDFDIIPPSYSGSDFFEKAETYGYYGIRSIDAPQRFGDDAFFDFSWGDSEIRYSWNSFTVGFGTQNIWLGPVSVNPILFSNNAAPFPKLDIGLRKKTIKIFDHDIGTFEARSFWGRLSESDYFDNNGDNDYNLLTGLSVSYSPFFAKGFTFGFHRTMQSNWEDNDWEGIFTLLWPFLSREAGRDERDQRASFTFDYLLPTVGLELYAEWARNDYSARLDYLIRYPFHTQAYTLGLKKSIPIPFIDGARGKLFIELTNLESSRDYDINNRKTTFYAHHIIRHGYTNRGQWLGAGIGTGGNSQILGAEIYTQNGMFSVFVQRRNPDNDYVWFMENDAEQKYRFRTDLSLGVEAQYLLNAYTRLGGGFVLTDVHNYHYEANHASSHTYNAHLFTTISILLD